MRTPFCLGLAVLAMANSPGRLNANYAEKPFHTGRPAGEPKGLGSVVIERESLTIDLRPLATLQPATVEATYRLRNDGATCSGELIFVSGSAVKPEDVRIQLNGQPIPCTAASLPQLPDRWRPPATTPAPGVARRRSPLSDPAGTPAVLSGDTTAGQAHFHYPLPDPGER